MTHSVLSPQDILEAVNEFPRAVNRKDVRQGLINLGLISPAADPEITVRRRLTQLADEGLLLRLDQDTARRYRVINTGNYPPSTSYWITPQLAEEIDRRCGRALATASGQ